MSVNILPEGWVSVTLADICSKPQYGYTTKSQLDGNVKFLRTTDITKGILNWDSVPYCEDPPTDLYKYQLYDRDIVISRAGSIGFSALIKNPPKKVVFASYLIRFKPSEFISEVFIKYFLNSHDYWTQLRLMSAGNAVQNVNAQKLSILNVPLPPLAEQKIIADKLDDLLARVESIKTRLENIPEILKKFRQSVLSAAVSGKLTEEWRVEKEEPISDLLKEIITDQKVAIKNKRVKKNFGNHNIVRPLFDLPDSCWEWVCFPQISETNNNALKAGPFGSALKKSDCVGDGYKVYGQEQVISGQE
ncbi:TPA: restriction endonuclease subunit S, partial [Klebsiella pneumoniae]